MIPHACSSWVAVDLGPHRALVPTAYCLLHGSQRRGNALRHWEFQVGAVDRYWRIVSDPVVRSLTLASLSISVVWAGAAQRQGGVADAAQVTPLPPTHPPAQPSHAHFTSRDLIHSHPPRHASYLWRRCRYAGDRRMTGLDASSATWTMDEPYSALAAVMPPRSPDASFSPPSPGRALTPARGNPSIARNRLEAQRARLQPRQVVQSQPMRGTGQLGMLACRPVCTPGGHIPLDSYVSAPGMVIEGLPSARGASPPKPNAAITSTQVALPSSSTRTLSIDALLPRHFFTAPSPCLSRCGPRATATSAS